MGRAHRDALVGVRRSLLRTTVYRHRRARGRARRLWRGVPTATRRPAPTLRVFTDGMKIALTRKP